MYSVEEFLEQADQVSDIDDDLEQNDESGPHEDEAEEVPDKKDDSATKVPKKVRKPSNRPKLDVERLKGPRGLASIEKLFSKVELKGNGHEIEDLQTVMRTLHYWCHRLFPKYSFDDCLSHLERLGHKKPLITLKKKILFDLFEDDDQPVNDNDDDQDMNQEQEAINEFDLLLEQEPVNISQERPKTPEQIQLTEEQKQIMERNRLLAIERRKARLEALQQKQLNESSQFTDEQKALIERNRQVALEKRRAKMNNSMVSSSQDTTIETVNSQTSSETPNFNELVDSFFPASAEDTDNPENDSQESVTRDIEINDLIEEINETDNQTKVTNETENQTKVTNETEKMDENDLIEEINETENQTKETNKTDDLIDEMENQTEVTNETETEKMDENEDEVDINDLLEDTNEANTTITNNAMDADNTKIVNNLNEDDTFDINSTKEHTTENLLETE